MKSVVVIKLTRTAFERPLDRQLVSAVVDVLGSGMEPMHEEGEGDLRLYFRTTVPAESASRFAEAVRSLPGVDAAYVKPKDSAPT